MSRRNGNSNNVRGPTSALTEFLRESGINIATIARRVATREQGQGQASAAQAQGQDQAPDVSTEQNPDLVDAEHDTAAPSSKRRGRRRQATATTAQADYESDQLDEAEEPSPPAKKRKVSAKGKGKATAAAKSKAKKKAKEDGDYEGSSEDEYRVASKSLWSMGNGNGPKPPVGSFEKCVRCEKQFTVTKYTLPANPPPGYLCHTCAKASGADPFKKPAAPVKRKPRAEKRDVVNFEERRLPTLTSLCIELIGKYINDVEALGDIGSVNLDELAKTLARNRSLTCENAQLFYDIQNKKLRFYDATNLTPPALTTLASLNPNLTHLHLDFCGRLTCAVMTAFSKSLPHLTHLSLLGPFLVYAEAWIEFFKAKPELRSFRIIQSPRFDFKCAQSLADHCSKLEELQLKEVEQLDDSFVEAFCALPPLKSLDLSAPGVGILESGWVELLERHGPTLESFDPSGHEGFTDSVLENGVRKHARVLSELVLEGLSGLTDEGVAHFFESWNKPFASTLDSEDGEAETEVEVEVDDSVKGDEALDFVPNPSLRSVSLARNYALSSASLTALFTHSAPSLVSINLNGMGPISVEALGQLKDAPQVQWLDVSWCREMDDFVMKDVVSNATKLTEVRVWGCTRIKGTGWAGKRGLKVYGIEPNAAS